MKKPPRKFYIPNVHHKIISSKLRIHAATASVGEQRKTMCEALATQQGAEYVEDAVIMLLVVQFRKAMEPCPLPKVVVVEVKKKKGLDEIIML